MNKKMYLGAVALSLLTGPLAFADETARGATVWDGFSGLLTPDEPWKVEDRGEEPAIAVL